MNSLVYFILLLFSLNRLYFCQDVFSCGGFIQSPVPINYASIMVKLFTPEGYLKYETDCAPTNGYYMIPVYSKGTYLLKVVPPTGWEFDPESVELIVDGVKDPCTKGQDINFVFRGFSVVGNVRNKNAQTGPTNFEVGLFKSLSVSTPILSTKTEKDGKYVFKGVTSGKYFVKSLEKRVCLEGEHAEVIVSEKPVSVSSDLIVDGFSVLGFVKNLGQPVSNAIISLFSGEKLSKTVEHCLKKVPDSVTLPNAPKNFHFVCAVASNDVGQFEFGCVPRGNFVVIPIYKTVDVAFSLTPKSIEFKVADASIDFNDAFEVKGFSVSGKVLWENGGSGVADAKVKVDDKSYGTADEKGVYFLNEVSTGSHKIEIDFPDVEFDAINVQLSPKNPKIPDIVAKRFNVCGKITIHSFPPNMPHLKQRKLLMTNEQTKEVVSLTTDADGKFCRMVSSNDYIFEPHILPNEREAGLSLLPKTKKVTVAHIPVKNVDFKQFEAKVSGTVRCLGVCKIVKLILKLNGAEIRKVELNLIDKSKGFEFKELLPAKYSVKIISDEYCWDEDERTALAESADVENVNFAQTGYFVSIFSSNEARMNYELMGDKTKAGEFSLKKGSNSFCLPNEGNYEFKLNSCHVFDQETYKFSTTQPVPLVFTATKRTLSGFVSATEIAGDFNIVVKSSKLSEQRNIGPLKTENVLGNETKVAKYFYQVIAEQGDEIEIFPKSSVFLFDPVSQNVVVRDECISEGLNFVAVRGLFLNGHVTPPLEGVKVSMTQNKKSEDSFNTATNSEGKFKIGPLRSLERIDISAEKSGYVFTMIDGHLGEFAAQKLSELTLSTLDTEGKPLAGVLLSLSGKGNYRSNNITEESGSINFVGLSPGEYYVKPIFKEYSFEPATKVVAIQEGSSVTVELVGKRVAYSCMGTVRHLAGQPVPQVAVEAFSPDCHQVHEEVLTGDDGSFKIRGLQPSCEYVLQLKAGQKFPSTVPQKHVVRLTNEDVTGKDLILKPEITAMELTGRVECDRTLLPSLKVVMYKESSPDTPLHSVHFPTASVFFLPSVNIDNTAYVARLETTLSSNEYTNLQTNDILFRANQTFQFLHFVFRPKRKQAEAEILRSGYIALPITIITMLLAYNYDKVAPIFQDWFKVALNMINNRRLSQSTNPSSSKLSGGASASEQFPSDDNGDGGLDSALSKKKTKARKV